MTAAWRGRFAPSPTGPIHLGNARTALVAWLSVRQRGGVLVWREEDLDPPRVVAGMAAAQRHDLAWLGLDWDEGPDVGGAFGPYRQSQCSSLYDAALGQLAAAGRLYPCRRSRRDLAAVSSAPHGAETQAPYTADLRPGPLPADWYTAFRAQPAPDAALRFTVAAGLTRFQDLLQGTQEEEVARSVGDFVLQRRDGLYAYQLAVVVDDLRMRIDEVVRGADLLASTARQVLLCEALGGVRPAYAHVPLVLDSHADKLAKRSAALSLGHLRDLEVRAEQIVGYLAWSLGLTAEPVACRPGDLLGKLDWQCLSREPFLLPEGWQTELRCVR